MRYTTGESNNCNMHERIIFLYIVLLAGLALSFAQSGGVLYELGGADAGAPGLLAGAGEGAPLTLFLNMVSERPGSVQMIVAALSAVVLASAALLLYLVRKAAAGRIAAVCAFLITAWAAGQASLPMAAATAIFCLGAPFGTKETKPVTLVVQTILICFVWLCLTWPGLMVVVTSALLLGFSLYIIRLMERAERLERSAEGYANRADEMRELLGSQRRVVRSTEHVSRLEERNRLAARIHDEIGHGMSGSILLLEGAELVMDKEPEKARETIRKVTENLRASVEKIRKVLREERSAGAEVSLARIENEMRAFEADHPHIKTRLDLEGDLDGINTAVWICIYENLVEALTNTLKHSAATEFHVSLKNSGGLLLAEFADNGGAGRTETPDGAGGKPGLRQGEAPSGFSQKRALAVPGLDIRQAEQGEITPGIGLQSMEERTAICHGRCFFRREPDGFHIVMTFPRSGSV